MVDSPTMRLVGSVASAARARARCACRSPMFEPSATYATSIIGRLFDDDFSMGEWSGQRDVRLTNRDSHEPDARMIPECVEGDQLADAFEEHRLFRHDCRGEIVQRAVVDDVVAILRAHG